MQIVAYVIIAIYALIIVSFVVAIILKIVEKIKQGGGDKYKNIKK